MQPLITIAGVAVAAGAMFLLMRKSGDVSGEDARKLVQGGARLLDVRTPGEFAGRNLPGAINIPVQELARRLKDVGEHERTIVVYCMSGARSGQAKRMLQSNGFTNVHDLGAMSRW